MNSAMGAAVIKEEDQHANLVESIDLKLQEENMCTSMEENIEFLKQRQMVAKTAFSKSRHKLLYLLDDDDCSRRLL